MRGRLRSVWPRAGAAPQRALAACRRCLADSDLEILRGDSEKLKDYVDQHVAHQAERPKLADVPTFDDLHQAIDDLGDMFKKYSQVLKAAYWATLEPAGQEDWRAIFRVPWNEPDPPAEPWH